MSEAEWNACTDPKKMLWFLGKVSDRKLRLFAAACCRRIWHLLPDERSRQAVEAAERYADAQATKKELEAAADAACAVWDSDIERTSTGGEDSEQDDDHPVTASQAAYNAAIPPGWWGAAPAFVAPDQTAREVAVNRAIERAAQGVLLRDLFGYPFRPVTLDPSWLTAQVVALAQAAYDDRLMPEGILKTDLRAVLADALEAAGSTDANILAHLRSPGPHVRGCWPVDAVLGKS